MNTFVNAIKNQEARTLNNMKARASTANACVDLFYKIGAMRDKDPIPAFVAALSENEDIALRIAQWARDARGGAGERQLFRAILQYLEVNRPELLAKVLPKVPELGRWDDLLELKTSRGKEQAFALINEALKAGNGLCAKWMPRKGKLAGELRAYFGLTPKQYRKGLVSLTKVVEQKMCANDWEHIEFSHVPSIAASRYKKAFYKHVPNQYTQYAAKLKTGEAKINANVVYPYQVIQGMHNLGAVELDVLRAQWKALPNYIGDASILAMVDVSGSMTASVAGKGVTAMDVAVSLGLYCAEKNTGVFKDTFLTFSGSPKLLHLKGDIVAKMQQMIRSEWGMNTNLLAAIDLVLRTAISSNARQEDMPAMLLVLSDMQFDACARFDDSAFEGIARRYEAAGYKMPKIVFWNINSYDNVPVEATKKNVALISGFSPAIMTSVLANDLESFSPESIMLKTVMVDRYKLL